MSNLRERNLIMIKLESYYIKNFKGFEDSGIVASDRINVFTGVNSGGKTTLIQGLLFIKQMLEGKDSDINFNGSYIKLGEFNDIVFKHSLEKEITIGLLINYSKDRQRNEKEKKKDIIFSAIVDEISKTKDKGHHYDAINIKVEFGMRKKLEEVIISSYRIEVFDPTGEYKSVFELKYDLKKDNYKITEDPLSSAFNWKEIKNVLDDLDLPDDVIKSIIKNNFDKMQNELNIRFDGPLIPKECYKEDIDDSYTFNKVFTEYIKHILKEITSKIYYIGPIRMQPQRLYRYDKDYDNVKMNYQGENATYIYNKISERNYDFILPPDNDGEKYDTIVDENRSFKEWITIWTKYIMGIKNDFLTNKKGISSYELKVNDHLITNVGFGASQIFPILVEGMREKDGIIIFEQPEIHLHPNAQARLVDFFIAIARYNNLKVIVETHSIHFIERLVRRMVEDYQLHEQVSILFVDTEKYLKSKITHLKYNELGGVEEWPDDFLNQTGLRETERLYRAQRNKLTEKE